VNRAYPFHRRLACLVLGAVALGLCADLVAPLLEAEEAAKLVEVQVEVQPGLLQMARLAAPVEEGDEATPMGLRALSNAELYFADRVCQLTPEQRRAVKAAGDACVKSIGRRLHNGQQGNLFIALFGTNRPPNPYRLLDKGLSKAFKAQLSPEQWQQYRAECDKRTTYRKAATVAVLVARLDEAVFLNDEQREQVTAALTAQWQESWYLSLEFWEQNEQYFPVVPEPTIAPLLTREQRVLWQQLQKISADDLAPNFDLLVEGPAFAAEPGGDDK
jgi:hypothetical protein